MGYRRIHPCIDCARPNSAFRTGTRCERCSVENIRRRKREYEDRHRPSLFRRVPKPPKLIALHADFVCLPSPDPIEQDRVMGRARQKARDAAAIAEAKRLLALYLDGQKPKRGRPRKGVAMQEAA